MELLDSIMKWVVAPVAAFVWLIHGRTQTHATEIAVMKATMTAQKEAHDRENKEIKQGIKDINLKLDNILELALRK